MSLLVPMNTPAIDPIDCLPSPEDRATHFQVLAPMHVGDPLVNSTQEISKLRQENAELRAAVGFLMLQAGGPLHTPRRTLCALPAEIIRLIFKEAIPAPYEYKLSLPDGPSNPWLQIMGTKVALSMICRALHWEGMAILYSDVVLRRMSQIFLLARTLRSPESPRGPDLCHLIKTIDMDRCPVGGTADCAAKDDLRSILQACHSLRSLSYRPHPNFPLLADERRSSWGNSYFNPTWFFDVSSSRNQSPFLPGPLASRLHRLNLQFILTPSRLRNLHELLLTTVSLQSLTLDYPDQDPIPNELDRFSAVNLPSLVELSTPFGQDATFDDYVCTRWDIPKLSRLTLVSYEWWPERPLESFGRHLVYLHLFSKYLREPFFSNDDPCPGLASLCPLLEHLVIPNPHNCLELFPQLTITSPTLKHLDIWDFGTHERLTTRARYYPWLASPASSKGGLVKKLRSENSIPSLRTVRSLFTEYGRYRGVDWPSICHPDLLLGCPDDEIWHSFPEAHVAQSATRLIPHSPHPLSDDDIFDDATSGSESDSEWTLSSSPVETDESSEGSPWTDEEVVEEVVEGEYM